MSEKRKLAQKVIDASTVLLELNSGAKYSVVVTSKTHKYEFNSQSTTEVVKQLLAAEVKALSEALKKDQ